MPDSFIVAGSQQAEATTWQAWGHMLGPLTWDEVGLLSRIAVGCEYDYDDVDWQEPRGDTQLGRIPQALTVALAELPDERVSSLAAAWHLALCAEAGWRHEDPHTLVEDLDGLRTEARSATKRGGALWLRIEV